MKKSLFFSLAAASLMASCADDAVLENEAPSADKYAGIDKVDATFVANFGEDETRMATMFGPEQGDKVGLAWLGTNTTDYGSLIDLGYNNFNPGKFDGLAYQNHPLYINGGQLKPITSIYVGEYFSYLPYDATTVDPGKINFSLAEQPLATSMNAAAPKSIWISAKDTKVTKAGTPNAAGELEDKAGIDGVFNIYPSQYSNLTRLDFTYVKNNPGVDDLEPAEIYSIDLALKSSLTKSSTAPYTYTVGVTENIVDFTYAPTAEVSPLADYKWKGLTVSPYVNNGTPAAYHMETADATAKTSEVAKFYLNTLPAKTAANATDKIVLAVTTDYGVVYVEQEVQSSMKTYKPSSTIDGWATDGDGSTVTPPATAATIAQSAINSLGNIAAITATIDFSTVVMHGMHVRKDEQLQKLLKFYKYINSADMTAGEQAVLNLDGNENNEFILSKESVALINEINNTAGSQKISVVGCTTHPAAMPATEVVLEGTGDMPKLNFFNAPTSLTLRGEWNMGETANVLDTDIQYINVSKFVNEGTVNFVAANIDNVAYPTVIDNAKDATINVKAGVVANLKLTTNNYGTINIPTVDTELLAYGIRLTNCASSLEEQGEIINSGVLATVNGIPGSVIANRGIIRKIGEGSKTYITYNRYSVSTFDNIWSSSNMMGTIILNSKDDDNYSISNNDNEGFIVLEISDKESIDGAADFGSQANYIRIMGAANSLTYTYDATDRCKYIEFAQDEELVWTSNADAAAANLPGLIVPTDKKVNIKKNNRVNVAKAFVQGTIYLGGFLSQSGVPDATAATQVMSGVPATDFVTYYGGDADDASNVRKF